MTDLITTADIAAALGSQRAYVTDRVVKRPDFPRPVLRLSQKTVKWARADFERWMDVQRVRAGKV